jgi:hypothetical protein
VEGVNSPPVLKQGLYQKKRTLFGIMKMMYIGKKETVLTD